MTLPSMEPIASRTVPPDPSITSAIGRHHTLETAVADLVDNSIDAGASHVLVRFMMEGARPVGLQVIDDGNGMDTAAIDNAMTYACRRDYDGRALGHFGIGLKAASLSQANTLLVWSTKYGSPTVGRRLRRETIDSGPVVEEFATSDAATRMQATPVDFSLDTGTVVEWQDVQTFLTSASDDDQTRWVSTKTQRLLEHLGLVFHRILARGTISLQIDTFDIVNQMSGAARTALPIDPFGYLVTPRFGYPKELPVVVRQARGAARLHVWPHRDRQIGYGQSGRSEILTQGFYVYRNDRLLQAGGWNGLANESSELCYARVEFDLDPALEEHVVINPEKAGTSFDDELRAAFVGGHDGGGTSFTEFLRDARDEARASRQRESIPIQAPSASTGLPATVRAALSQNTVPSTQDPVEIKWRMLSAGEVYRIDVRDQALILNALYREAIVGRRSLDIEDAPLVKSLLLLLLADHFLGTGSGARRKREDAAWQAVLLAAVDAQKPKS